MSIRRYGRPSLIFFLVAIVGGLLAGLYVAPT